MTGFLRKHLPLRAPEDGGGGGDSGGDKGGDKGGGADKGTGGGDPWHKGVDAEIIGHWQNKGWKVDDPKEVALAATKQAREAEKFFGVPADQLLKLPKADARPEDIKAFWNRLGAPAEAKDYDFNGVKLNGNDIEPAFADAMRAALAAAYVPKDKAAPIVAAVAKYLETADSDKSTVAAAKLAEEKALLDKNWGPNKEFNMLNAQAGARRLGIAPEAVKAMENQIGYAAVMEAMRKIGVGTSEDNFVERGTGSNGSPTTREGAVSRKAELMGDPAWGKRYVSGDAQAKMEMDALNVMIDGQA